MISGRRAINVFLRFAFHVLSQVHVQGVENVPMQGRLVVMFNHVNFLDAPAIAAFWPRELEALTKAENLRSGILAPFMRLYGATPVNRGEVDRRALATATGALEGDRVLLISPEGTRSRGKGLGKAKDGMALMAVRTQSPLIPVAVCGQEHVVPGWSHFKRERIDILIGRPFRFDYEIAGKIDREAVRQMTTEAMYILSAMLPDRYRGVYSDLSQATTQYIRYLSPEMPGTGIPAA